MGHKRRVTVCARPEYSPAPNMARDFVKPYLTLPLCRGNRLPDLQPVAMLCIDCQSKVQDFTAAFVKNLVHHYLLT